MNDIKPKLISLFRIRTPFAATLALSFFLTMVLIRITEIVVLSANHHIDNAFILLLKTWVSDFGFSFLIFLFLVLIAPFLKYKRNRQVILVLLSIIAIFHLISAFYYAISLNLLDHTLYQFTFSELKIIIKTFGLFKWYYLLIPISFLIIFLINSYLQKRKKSIVLFLSFAILFLTAYLFLFIGTEENPQNEAIIKNKTVHFISSSFDYFISDENNFDFKSYSPQREFPLFDKEDYANTLGPYFKLKEEPPNFVFIIVESLSSAYSGRFASELSFSPFLDSLADESLYFKNFLSTSERTFGVLPGVLASLPHGEKGFNAMKHNMPNHHSLPKILFDNGYYGAFFYGGDAHFDFMKIFIENNGFEYIYDHAEFNYEGTGYVTSVDPVPFGINDKILFDHAARTFDSLPQSQTFLHVFLTLSMHYPFIVEGQEIYMEEAKRIINSQKDDKTSKEKYLKYLSVFSTCLYTDDAIRNLIDAYKKKKEFENTIFLITGDHSLGSIPHRDQLEKYRSPLIIYSPLLTRSHVFPAVNSHLDITPSILALLKYYNSIQIPDSSHWLGESFDTSSSFMSDRQIGFMLNSRDARDYLENDIFLSQNKLYKINNGLTLTAIKDPEALNEMKEKHFALKNLHKHVVLRNKLIPETDDLIVLKNTSRNERNFTQKEEYIMLLEHELEENYEKLVLDMDLEIIDPEVGDSNIVDPIIVLTIHNNNPDQKPYWEKFVYKTYQVDSLNPNRVLFQQNIQENSSFKITKGDVLKLYLWNTVKSDSLYTIRNSKISLKAPL